MNEIKSELLKVIGLLDQAQQTTFKQIQKDNYKHSKALNDRIVELEAELDRISQELAKRPVVYCYRNKHGELAQHFGSGSLALWAKPEKQAPTNPELEWKIEVYTGQQS